MAKGETIKNYQEGLKENMVGFTNELTKVFPDLKITSGFRKKAFTKQGNVSRHALGEAIDIEARQDVYDYLWNTKDGITLVNKYNLGILDETNPETLKKTGGTGVHYHIGADSTLVPKAQQRYKELVGEKQTTPTTPLTNFDIPTINRSFASVPDSPKEETKKEEKPSEALNQLKEEEFVKQYKSLFTQPQVAQQEQEVNQPTQTADLQGIFNQVSQFVDGSVAQQGGKKPIYVTDKNDPIYVAYQDSLRLYNLTNNIKNETKEAKNLKVEAKDVESLYRLNEGFKNNEPIEIIKRHVNGEDRVTGIHKEPTQPILLEQQEPRPKVQGLNTNTTPAGIKTQQELPQGEELPQRTYAQIPTSYDVSSQRYNMQGENPYYNFNAEKADYETALRAKLAAENYNAEIERIYGNEEALKNPKAVERLNQLRQEVKITPNYQNGGEIIKDNNGYWNPNNWGKTVQIDGGDITMKGVHQILEGYSPETGERKLMIPNFDYKFSGAKRVIETPLKDNEIEFLKNIKK